MFKLQNCPLFATSIDQPCAWHPPTNWNMCAPCTYDINISTKGTKIPFTKCIKDFLWEIISNKSMNNIKVYDKDFWLDKWTEKLLVTWWGTTWGTTSAVTFTKTILDKRGIHIMIRFSTNIFINKSVLLPKSHKSPVWYYILIYVARILSL